MRIFLYTIIYLLVFYMGATVFSYLWLVAERLPKQEDLTVRHTVCAACGHEQTWQDGVPIFSRIRYQNRCRYCGSVLPKGELIFELAGGALAALSFWAYGIQTASVLMFLVACDLALIAVIDAKTGYIPPVLNGILFALGVIGIWIMPDVPFTERLIGMAAVSVPMLLIALLFHGFGLGDVKMMAAAGMLLGWKGTVAAFLMGAITGGAYAIWLLATHKKGKKDSFAFGPFLAFGVLVSMLRGCGDMLVTAYLNYVQIISASIGVH